MTLEQLTVRILEKKINHLIAEEGIEILAEFTGRFAKEEITKEEKIAFVVGKISAYKSILAGLGYEI